MINLDLQMLINEVEDCKSSTGKSYKKVKMTGSAGSILTCLFEEDKIFHEINKGERRKVTVVSRIYNGKEKVFVNIKGLVLADEATPFGDVEAPWENVADAPAFKDMKKGK